LLRLEQVKTEAVASAADSAVSVGEKRKAIQTQSMIRKIWNITFFYNYLMMNPYPHYQRIDNREDRIARAAAKRSQFKFELSQLVIAIHHDHTYCCSDIPATSAEIDSVPQPQTQHLIRSLYEEHVCISPSEAVGMELVTRINRNVSFGTMNESFT